MKQVPEPYLAPVATIVELQPGSCILEASLNMTWEEKEW